MRHRFTTNALGFLLKNATILLQHAIFVKKMRQYKEKLKDVLLDIYLKPLSNDLSSLFDKKKCSHGNVWNFFEKLKNENNNFGKSV